MDDIALQCHDREKPPRGFGMGRPRRKRPVVLVLTIAATNTVQWRNGHGPTCTGYIQSLLK